MQNKYKPVALIILDGWGYREDPRDNAIAEANKPFFDHLWQTFPHCLLSASGPAVGLPEGQIGNSEVGHMTIGAGRTIDTDLVRISKAIQNGEFSRLSVFRNLFDHVKAGNSTLHVMGLIGPGGVHSYQEHLIAFLHAARDSGVSKIAVHAFMDGRDLAPQSGAAYLDELDHEIASLGIGRIATVCGRYFAMDRDNNWSRVELAMAAMQKGQGEIITEKSAGQAVREKYALGEVDEHLKPLVFPDHDGKISALGESDAVFIFNFRADRARMIAKKLKDDRKKNRWFIATMTEYGRELGLPAVFPPLPVEDTLAKTISANGLTQAHVAETEKFAHATYFLNGGVEQAYPGEKQILIDSRKDIATHDQAPEMKAREITDAAIAQMTAGTDFVFVNFANADMVGHTANIPAIITAIETLDKQLRRLVEKTDTMGGVAVIAADHGNAELNIDPETGERHTAHTTSSVPCIITVPNLNLRDGSLANLAATVLTLMGLPKPASMTEDLIIDINNQLL